MQNKMKDESAQLSFISKFGGDNKKGRNQKSRPFSNRDYKEQGIVGPDQSEATCAYLKREP